jgi:hypothetical protein
MSSLSTVISIYFTLYESPLLCRPLRCLAGSVERSPMLRQERCRRIYTIVCHNGRQLCLSLALTFEPDAC